MIWLIVLAVWLLASVLWWYSMYKEYGFLRVSDIYQGIFASIPGGIVKLHEYLDDHWSGWNYPLFMNKELKADIDFTNKEMDEHIKNVAKELMEEIGLVTWSKNSFKKKPIVWGFPARHKVTGQGRIDANTRIFLNNMELMKAERKKKFSD